jgi:YidC/Oxa1 family membrane protein insertase
MSSTFSSTLRTIFWIAFALSLALLWDAWRRDHGLTATFFPQADEVLSTPAASTLTTASVNTATHANQSVAQPADLSVPTLSNPTPAPTSTTTPAIPPSVEKIEPRITARNDVMSLTFSLQGGTLVGNTLFTHHDDQKPPQTIHLLTQEGGHTYIAQSGLIGPTDLSLSLNWPTHKTDMTWVPGPLVLEPGQQELRVQFRSPPSSPIQLTKTYVLVPGQYRIRVEHTVSYVAHSSPLSSTSAPSLRPSLYLQLVRDGSKSAEHSSVYSTFTGPAIYTDSRKYQKIEFADIDAQKVEIPETSTGGYVAMVQHYFLSSWWLPASQVVRPFVRKLDNNLYATGQIADLGDLKPGQSTTIVADFYSGPQEEKVLESLTPGLELVKDYGWLALFSKPLYWLLHAINQLVHNWGWAIVLLVVLLKGAFYGLNAKAYRSMAKMKAVQPRIEALRSRYKDKPAQLQQEMLRIYREEKVSPLGGCLPIVIQIPVFIALYWVLLASVETRHAPWMGWIHDLSAPDPYYILPVLMALSSLAQTALNPAPADPMQAKLMWIMPLAFSVMFFFFPSGLVLYWVTNNVLSIAQQWFINQRFGLGVTTKTERRKH